LRILTTLLLATLASCTLRLPALEGRAGPPPFDCEQVALKDGLGDPDPCDVAACEACVDACGADCAVQESYPPQYSCDEGGAVWEVYDTCPDWTLPAA
jgi:hypothetical protein